MSGKPFTHEELEQLVQNPDAVRFMASATGTMKEMRARARALYLRPPTLADQLRELNFANPAYRLLVDTAADELDLLAKQNVRRPISELRQEPGAGASGGANRWVILWGPSGYSTPDWRCAVGRRAPVDAKFAGRFITHDGECFTDGGEDATHFSELPREE